MRDALINFGLFDLPSPILRVPGRFATTDAAWHRAAQLFGDDGCIASSIEVIGDFTLPPLHASSSRDFQTLHFDFGVPLVPSAAANVARVTALHIPAAVPSTKAFTRFVPLRALLSGHAWPSLEELTRRFVTYGDTHGAWEPETGYIEGSLARMIDAALGQAPVLPSVTAEPNFLCGTEFASITEETRFFTARGLPVDVLAVEIRLEPGELLLFDNLAVAHGRRGSRSAGELRQRVFGHRALNTREQLKLRNRVLGAFAG